MQLNCITNHILLTSAHELTIKLLMKSSSIVYSTWHGLTLQTALHDFLYTSLCAHETLARFVKFHRTKLMSTTSVVQTFYTQVSLKNLLHFFYDFDVLLCMCIDISYYICVHTTKTHEYTNIIIHTRIHTHTNTHTYIHTYTHMQTQIHTHANIHTQLVCNYEQVHNNIMLCCKQQSHSRIIIQQITIMKCFQELHYQLVNMLNRQNNLQLRTMNVFIQIILIEDSSYKVGLGQDKQTKWVNKLIIFLPSLHCIYLTY